MGTVDRKRLFLVVLLSLAVLVPATGHATSSTTYTPADFQQGPQGGDSANHFINVDPATGQMTILRVQPAGVSGNLGCGGQGGYSYFKVAHPTPGITSVKANFSDAIVDPYTFVDVAVRQGTGFLGSNSVRGLIVTPVVGPGSVTVDLRQPSTDAIEVWFGIQVTSACPNVDGGTATFTSVAVTSA